MFIQEIKKKTKNKTYYSTLLLESYREGKKVRHRTISNLSRWPKNLIEEFKLLLKGGKVVMLEDLKKGQGKSCGALIVLYKLCKRLGILKALGDTKNAKLATVLIIARVFGISSRLYIAKSWAKDEAIEEVLKIKSFDEDDLYKTLEWLSINQEKIEERLFKHRHKDKIDEIFLYDVTSTYFEGMKNELAEWGYDRDGKKGKKQIVIGLLTDREGYPVSIEVFKGNTQDPKTVINQLKKLKYKFEIKRVIFVGDRGMIKKAQIEDINEFKWNFISAITKPQIEKLLNIGVMQMSLFEEKITEVYYENYRYIVRRNPERAKEIERNRKSRIEYIIKIINKKNSYLLEHKKASVEVAIKNINEEIEKRKLKGIIKVGANSRTLTWEIDDTALKDSSRLDGCYVIKTDLPKDILSKEIIHDRYKDLTLIERAFRTIKTTLEKIRPVYVRKECSTRGHVFVCMLAYVIAKYIWDNLKGLGFPMEFIFSTLDKIQYSAYEFKDRIIKVLPDKLLEHQKLIIDKLQIKLPHIL